MIQFSSQRRSSRLARLLTTAVAMDGHPLTNNKPGPPALDDLFRSLSGIRQESPKLWADAYVAAHASSVGAVLISFDQALASFPVECRILS